MGFVYAAEQVFYRKLGSRPLYREPCPSVSSFADAIRKVRALLPRAPLLAGHLLRLLLLP